MFWYKSKVVAFALLYSFFLFSLFGEEILKIGYHEFYPELYTGDDGRAAGRMCENIRAAAERAGYQVIFSALPEKRIYHMLIRGRLDGWFGTTTVPFLQGETVSSSILVTKKLQAYFPKTYAVPTNDEQFFIDKKVTIVKGYSYGRLGEFLEKESSMVELITTNTIQEGFTTLSVGDSNYFIAYKSNVDEVIDVDTRSSFMSKEVGTIGFTLLSPNIVNQSRKIVYRFSKAWKELEREGKIK